MNRDVFYVIVTVLLTVFPVQAGGISWKVRVLEHIDQNTPILKLQLLEEPVAWERLKECNKITVFIENSSNLQLSNRFPFFSYYSNPSKEETLEAIDFLNSQFEKSVPTRFGAWASGLVENELLSCSFNSKGLRLRSTDSNGNYSVYSYYDYQ